MQEGIKLMRVGEEAKFILPSYLGHGLLGDRYTIPPQAILYIDVKLLEIK
ncbi:MAG: FKBP-type peptidyl-prolyl cis-trans isomerase [Crocinitomicaceae bacterium]